MKRLMLMRHAKSSWDNPAMADFDRPLSRRGRNAADAMALHMAARGMRPGLVLCSPARRARETLERLERVFGAVPPSRIDDALYEAEAEALLDHLRRDCEPAASVLLIGHNPSIQALALLAIGSGDLAARERMLAKFPTGALAVLRCDVAAWADVLPGRGFLDAYVCPRELETPPG